MMHEAKNNRSIHSVPPGGSKLAGDDGAGGGNVPEVDANQMNDQFRSSSMGKKTKEPFESNSFKKALKD